MDAKCSSAMGSLNCCEVDDVVCGCRYMGIAFQDRPELEDVRGAFTSHAQHLAQVQPPSLQSSSGCACTLERARGMRQHGNVWLCHTTTHSWCLTAGQYGSGNTSCQQLVFVIAVL